ncbi:N-acetyltransferase eco [Diplonema papillatum]|nr:N-acetyltransferase eco [Diplonema papillatum]
MARKRKREESGGAAPIKWKWKRSRAASPEQGFDLLRGSGIVRTIVIHPEDAKRNAGLLQEVYARMEAVLGRDEPEHDAPPSKSQKRVIVAVTPHKGVESIVGVVVCEQLSSAWRMVDAVTGDREVALIRETVESGADIKELKMESLPSSSSSAAGGAKEPGSPAESSSCSSAEKTEDWSRARHVESLLSSGHGCICGVSRIWVEPAFRRRGIATQLVEAARNHLVYGCAVPRDQVAFSQPTPAGKLLARTFAGRSDFFVYS